MPNNSTIRNIIQNKLMQPTKDVEALLDDEDFSTAITVTQDSFDAIVAEHYHGLLDIDFFSMRGQLYGG